MRTENLKKAGLAGASAATIAAMMFIMPWEGRVYKPYKDIGGVWTVCDGHTGPDIVLDKTYTDPECDNLTARDVRRAELQVDNVIKVKLPLKTKVAFISFTYNVGPQNLKNSTLARKANALDLEGACSELSRWTRVKGVIIKGLVNRRLSEKALCLEGLGKNPWYGV